MFSRWRHPEWWSAQQNAYAYYGAVLKGKNGLVFDLGANVGDLTAVFVQLGMRVIACEPDPVNFTILKARFRHIPDVTVLEVAISDKTGTVELYPMAAHGRSLTTISEKRRRQLAGHTGSAGGGNFDPTQTVNSMTPAELIDQYGLPEYIKIDVEGMEWPVVSSLPKAVPLLSFEANLPDFMPETLKCLTYLHTLNPKVVFNCSSDDIHMLLPDYLAYDQFLSWLSKQQYPYLEIFCRSDFRQS
jgi:FkbM family methyltransferase